MDVPPVAEASLEADEDTNMRCEEDEACAGENDDAEFTRYTRCKNNSLYLST